MELLVVCPANCATGGPEALHDFTHRMCRLGVDARLWYWGVSSPDPMPEEYKGYGCKYVTDLPQGYSGAIVFPEIWANCALDYPGCTRAVWWLGVDAYAGWTSDRGAFLRDDSIIHIAQSEYAYDFLQKLGVRRLYRLTDPLNADFYAPYVECERDDVVLYNPAKMTAFQAKVMESCPGIAFKQITGMTRAEVIDAMRHAKLYIDFGEFPGRERMPREAVLQGCCIITGKLGAAAYQEDFDHGYKYDSKDSHIWAIVHKIRYVLTHYEDCVEDFSDMYWQLRQDVNDLKRHYRKVLDEIQRDHTGA